LEESIEINGNRIRLEFVKKPWIRNSYLKFNGDRLVVVSRSERMMQKVVSSHRPWIARHYNQIRSSIRMFDSNSIFYGSLKYNVGYVQAGTRAKADMIGSNLIIYAPDRTAAERLIDRMVRDDTERLVPEIAAAKSKQIGRPYRAVKTRKSRRWGVCRSDGTITFNYCISMLPKRLQDYIVSHEVAHLREMNHSAGFWEVVSTLCPDYKRLRRELRDYDNTRRRVLDGPESSRHGAMGSIPGL
jgi:predicted metal-dependent hydrolase